MTDCLVTFWQALTGQLVRGARERRKRDRLVPTYTYGQVLTTFWRAMSGQLVRESRWRRRRDPLIRPMYG